MLRNWLTAVLWLTTFAISTAPLAAQDNTLTFTTVERPPFSMPDGEGNATGFAVELMRAIAAELGKDVQFEYQAGFAEMLRAVEEHTVDGAVANISITSAREQVMDFSQPIFESGLQIMLPAESEGVSLFSALFTRDIALFLAAAFGILFLFGILMWAFERNRQPYFQRPFKEALFPSFWWALNLVVNGGFEERVPQSRIGRFFGVMLVVSSLFIVSIFVAQITAAMTVAAISESVNSLSDIEGRKIGTTEGSTGDTFLNNRQITHRTYGSLDELLKAFEREEIDTVVFDGPLLKWYLQNNGADTARLVDRVFKAENYGIVLPSGSPLREEINRALLTLRESGAYDEIYHKYFGA